MKNKRWSEISCRQAFSLSTPVFCFDKFIQQLQSKTLECCQLQPDGRHGTYSRTRTRCHWTTCWRSCCGSASCYWSCWRTSCSASSRSSEEGGGVIMCYVMNTREFTVNVCYDLSTCVNDVLFKRSNSSNRKSRVAEWVIHFEFS